MATIKVSDHQTARLLILEKVYHMLANNSGGNSKQIKVSLKNTIDLHGDKYYIECTSFGEIISHEMLSHMVTEKIEIKDDIDNSKEEFAVKKVGRALVYRPIEKPVEHCVAIFKASLDKVNILKTVIEKLNSPKVSEEKVVAIEDDSQNQKLSSAKPYTTIESGKGYLKFKKHSEKFLIGKSDTRKFKLLRFMCDPIKTPRTIESIFEAIRKPKDINDSALNNYNAHQVFLRKRTLIEYQIKELQKIKKLQGRLRFEFNESQKTYRLIPL